jgi:DNA-binding beta-propeller fold protein YncE
VGAKGRDVDQTIPADTINYGLGSLWITYAATGRVYRVDPATGRTLASITVGPYPQALTFAAGQVWVADREDGAVREIDPRTNRVVGAPINVSREPVSQGRSLGDMLWLGTTANGDIWLYDPNHDRIAHIDPRNRELSFEQPSGANGDIAVAAGATAWIVGSRSVSRVNVANGRMVDSRVEVDTEPVGAAATPGSVWTTTLSGGIIRINR